jgi:hypothetical protein
MTDTHFLIGNEFLPRTTSDTTVATTTKHTDDNFNAGAPRR